MCTFMCVLVSNGRYVFTDVIYITNWCHHLKTTNRHREAVTFESTCHLLHADCLYHCHDTLKFSFVADQSRAQHTRDKENVQHEGNPQSSRYEYCLLKCV